MIDRILCTNNKDDIKTLTTRSKILRIPLTIQTKKEIYLLIEIFKSLMPAGGLAAPQIGINKRFFVFSPSRNINDIKIVINPIILSSTSKIISWEGCFSCPMLACKLYRAKKLHVSYFDLYEEKHICCYSYEAARIFQHELDHLDGVLIKDKEIDRILFLEHKKYIKFLKKQIYEKKTTFSYRERK